MTTILDDTAAFLSTYMAFPSEHELNATALWVAHAHAVDAFESTPRLAALSPEPGSGKTRLLECLEVLSPRPMHVLSASPAAIFRSIEVERPTLLLDEVDAVFGRKGKNDSAEDLRGLLNAGHRSGATIPRCVGKSFEVKQFPVYCAVALAGLGDLPDTLMSRSVVLRMKRRAPGETIRSFRIRDAGRHAEPIRTALAEWAAANFDALSNARPPMPSGVHDRPADVWEPLLAVAQVHGAGWPTLAHDACTALVKVAENREASIGVKLLDDIRGVFGDRQTISTDALITALCELPDAPWSDLYGKPITPRWLAKSLRGYQIEPKKVWYVDQSLQGYERAALWDAWTRYLPPPKSHSEHANPEGAEGMEGDAGRTSSPSAPSGKAKPETHPMLSLVDPPPPDEDCPQCGGFAPDPLVDTPHGPVCRSCAAEATA